MFLSFFTSFLLYTWRILIPVICPGRSIHLLFLFLVVCFLLLAVAAFYLLDLAELQRKRLKAGALVNQIENNNEYLRIKNAVEEKVNSTLSNGASLLKLAVACVIHSIRSNPEQYASLMYGKYSPANYNLPS